MLAQERHRRIMAMLEDREVVPVTRLREALPVSHMTIWRDLKDLERRGLARHVHGGVVREDDFSPHPERRVGQKEVVNGPQKRAIAARAVEQFVRPGHTMCIEGGTTVMATIPNLNASNLTVLTNSLEVTNRIYHANKGINLINSGGILRELSGTFYGPTTDRFFQDFAPELLFIGGSGIDVGHGLTDTTPVEIQAKQAMIQSAKYVVALLDSSKFGRRSLMQVCDLSSIDALVTDDGADRETCEAIEQCGVTLLVAESDVSGQPADDENKQTD
jgi:DeoR family glucitol operon repressor